MITRNLSVSDAEKIFDAFKSVSVSRGQENAPDYGFYDYPLTQEDFKLRLHDSRLSIALEDGKDRRLAAYILAYPFNQVGDMDVEHDVVLANVCASASAIYLDQLFIRPGLPLFIVGRLFDVWTQLAQGYTSEGIVAAAPQKPWKNIASTRFALSHGFSRKGNVKSGNLELGVFAKPFWQLGDEAKDIKLEFRN